MASQTLPVVSGDKDRSLQEALGRLTASPAARRRRGGRRSSRRRGGCPRSRRPTRRFRRAPTSGLRGARRRAASSSSTRTRPRRSRTSLGGRNVVTITPTASGKTLCYNAPVLNAILKDPSTRALYLFPTKALAQDQLAELHALVRAGRSARAGAIGSRSASSPTTATRRRTRGARSAARRTSCSATPTCCTRASCRTIRAGRSSSRTCGSS